MVCIFIYILFTRLSACDLLKIEMLIQSWDFILGEGAAPSGAGLLQGMGQIHGDNMGGVPLSLFVEVKGQRSVFCLSFSSSVASCAQ